MPKVSSLERTFAFSERLDSWTTRYSFMPTSYANCGDVMLSSADNKKIWKHDVNENRNNFYAKEYISSIEVSFNDLPHDIKVFNSISVETNANVTGNFYIQDDMGELPYMISDGQTSVYTNSTMSDESEIAVDLEGFKYLPVPRRGSPYLEYEDLKTDSNTIYLGSVDFDLSLITEDWFSEQEGVFEFKARLSKASDVSVPVGRYNSYNIPILSVGPEVLVPAGSSFNTVIWDSANQQDLLTDFLDQSFYTNSAGGSNLNSFFVVGQEGDVLTIIYKRRQDLYYQGPPESFVPIDLFFEDFNPSNLVISEPFSSIFNNGEPLFLQTPSSINGEQLRSPYMRARLDLRTLGKYMELNAVNADYDISPNHHSLTQKS